jgi:hypothetical protein
LLGNVDTGGCYNKNNCVAIAFIAVKKCIANNWKVGHPPTMSQWMPEMSNNVTRFDLLLD